MRKITLPALALAALIVTSCAKEKDAYDKNLTKDTWTLSSSSDVQQTVTKTDYNNFPDETNTQRTTETIGGGKRTVEQYESDETIGAATTFNKNTNIYDFSSSYKFEEEGTFTSTTTQKLTSQIAESDGNPPATTPVSGNENTAINSDIWAWQNTADQKALLTFALGSLQVESISKSELKLKLNTSETTVAPSALATVTKTETRTVSITMTR